MMNTANRFERNRHRECWDLLPWLVNETLSDAQKQRLEAHLSGCEECRREAGEQKLLRDHLRQEDSVLYAPQASFQKLMNRIDAADSQPEVEAPRRLVEPRYRKFLAAAAVLACVTVVSVVGLGNWLSDRYVVVTNPEPTMSVPAARVVFAPATSLDELNALLHTYRAQVVTGPTEAGVYTLVFDAPNGAAGRHAESKEVAATILELRKNPQVLFAEPVGPAQL